MEDGPRDDQAIPRPVRRPDRAREHRPAGHAGQRPPLHATSASPRCSAPRATSPSSWTSSATTRSGRPSTTSSTRATSASRTSSSSRCGWPRRRKRLKLGCAFNVLPMWHPIRLAEDYAMADIVTDGRVIMGVGRGYHSREVESFGAPVIDQAANRALFEEQVDLMLKCFNEESFSHHGKAYQVPPPVEYRGYQLQRDHLRAAAQAPAGRDLDADRQQQVDRLHGQQELQGHGHAQRREDPRRRRQGLPRRLRQVRPSRSSSART